MERDIMDSAEYIKNSAEYLCYFSDLITKSERKIILKDIKNHVDNIIKYIEKDGNGKNSRRNRKTSLLCTGRDRA